MDSDDNITCDSYAETEFKSKTSASTRKANKPLMEKRRRARINESLGQLKSLVLDALKKDTSRYSKLEKADILDMTVKHLRNLQRQQMVTASIVQDSNVVSKYRAGYNECAGEVTRYLHSVEGISPDTRVRLMGHLANCLKNVSHPTEAPSSTSPNPVTSQASTQPISIQIPAASPISTLPGGRTSLNTPVLQTATPAVVSPQQPHLAGALQLVPGQLPSGELAFFLPSQSVQSHLIPVYSNGQSIATLPVALQPTHVMPVQTKQSPTHAMDAPNHCCKLGNIEDLPKAGEHARTNMPQPQVLPPNGGPAVKLEEDVWRPW